VRTYITIEALPTDIPPSIDVDISEIGIGDSLSLTDVPVPDTLTFVDDLDTTLFTVQAPRVEAEPEVAVLLDEEGMPIEPLVEGEEGAEEAAEAEGEAAAESGDEEAEG